MSLAASSLSNCLLPGYSPGRVLCGRVGAQLGRILGAVAASHRVPGGRPASIFAGESAADRGATGSLGSVAHTTQFQALSAAAPGTVATAPSQRRAGMSENRAFRGRGRLIDNLQTLPLRRAGSASCAASPACAGRGGATPSTPARASYIPSRASRLKTGKSRPKSRPYPAGIDRHALASFGEGSGSCAEISKCELGSGVRVPRNAALATRKRAQSAESGRVVAREWGAHVSLDLRRVEHQAKVRG